MILLCFTAPASAQIGGKTVDDGPFLIDNAEDLNTTAESLGRDWVTDFVNSSPVLNPFPLQLSGLTLLPAQSPLGAFRALVPSKQGMVLGGFGIPMPGEIGASTLTSPGNITSFTNLTFFACYLPQNLSGLECQILLECYPGNTDGSYPSLFWNYTPPAGSAFGHVSIPLHSPSGIIDNPGALAVQDLLSKTRFLYFGFYCPATNNTLSAHLDDIRLVGPAAGVVNWERFR